MNLTINGHTVTLGPRALAHVETMKSPYFTDAAIEEAKKAGVL